MQYLCLHIHPNAAQVHLFAEVFKLYNRDATIQLSPWFNTFCCFWFSSGSDGLGHHSVYLRFKM